MRTFIAVPMGNEVRETLRALLDALNRQCPDARWSHPDNIHITLRFLGEVPDRDIADVSRAAALAAESAAPFDLTLSRLGGFGGRQPRVMKVSLSGETDRLKVLQADLEDRLEHAGFGREQRAFKPHVTLGRRKNAALPADWDKTPLSGPSEFTVDSLIVFASQLTRRGPIYTPMATYTLTGNRKNNTEQADTTL